MLLYTRPYQILLFFAVCVIGFTTMPTSAQTGGIQFTDRSIDPIVIAPYNDPAIVEIVVSGDSCTANDSPYGVDVALLVDQSGSMEHLGKLTSAVSAGKSFLKRLTSAEDRTALIPFDTIPLVTSSLTDSSLHMATALEEIEPQGRTNIAFAITIAQAELENNASDNRQAMVILSDGQHTGEESLEDAVQTACDAGIQLHTIGIGNGVDSRLQTIPCNGGQYFHAPDPASLSQIYHSVADVLLGTIATDVTVTDHVPDGFSIYRVSDGGKVVDNTITWNIPRLEASRVFTYEVIADVETGYLPFDAGAVTYTGCSAEENTSPIPTISLSVDLNTFSENEWIQPVDLATFFLPPDIIALNNQYIASTSKLDSCNATFIDLRESSSGFALGDDQYRRVTIPFPFEFAGEAQTELTVSNNGTIQFGEDVGYVHWDNRSLENAPIGLYPLWDDWLGGTVQTLLLGELPNQKLVIQWTEREHYWNRGDQATFQVILSQEENQIQYVYDDVAYQGNEPWITPAPTINQGGDATIGLVAPNNQIIEYSVNQAGAVDDGFGICFNHPDDLILSAGVSKDGSCSNVSSTEIILGEDATWCYQLFNQTTAPITITELVDSAFGTWEDATGIQLAVGESAEFSRTVPISSTQTLTNSVMVSTTENVMIASETVVTVANIGINAMVRVGLTPESCIDGSTNRSVPIGSQVYICYEGQNTTSTVLDTHTIHDSVLGTIVTDVVNPITFKERMTVVQTVLITETTMHDVLWTAGVAGSTTTDQHSYTITATEPQAEYLSCNQAVGFETGIPSNWTTESLMAESAAEELWTISSSPTCSFNGNEAGAGFGICTHPQDTAQFNTVLVSNEFDLSYSDTKGEPIQGVQLRLRASYQPTMVQNEFSIEISTNNSSWTALNSWYIHEEDDGKKISVDLNNYAGYPNVRLRIRYQGTNDTPPIQVDSLAIACSVNYPIRISNSDSLEDWQGESYQPAIPTTVFLSEQIISHSIQIGWVIPLGLMGYSTAYLLRRKNL